MEELKIIKSFNNMESNLGDPIQCSETLRMKSENAHRANVTQSHNESTLEIKRLTRWLKVLILCSVITIFILISGNFVTNILAILLTKEVYMTDYNNELFGLGAQMHDSAPMVNIKGEYVATARIDKPVNLISLYSITFESLRKVEQVYIETGNRAVAFTVNAWNKESGAIGEVTLESVMGHRLVVAYNKFQFTDADGTEYNFPSAKDRVDEDKQLKRTSIDKGNGNGNGGNGGNGGKENGGGSSGGSIQRLCCNDQIYYCGYDYPECAQLSSFGYGGYNLISGTTEIDLNSPRETGCMPANWEQAGWWATCG